MAKVLCQGSRAPKSFLYALGQGCSCFPFGLFSSLSVKLGSKDTVVSLACEVCNSLRPEISDTGMKKGAPNWIVLQSCYILSVSFPLLVHVSIPLKCFQNNNARKSIVVDATCDASFLSILCFCIRSISTFKSAIKQVSRLLPSDSQETGFHNCGIMMSYGPSKVCKNCRWLINSFRIMV